MSYPKALKGLSKSAPQFDVTVFCETPACSCVQSWNHPCCSQTFTELELTKSRAYRYAIEAGWTHSDAGRWRCPCGHQEEAGRPKETR